MKRHYTVFLDDHAWRIGAVAEGTAQIAPVPSTEDDANAVRVEAVKQQLEAHGYGEEPIVLALPSSWCLCAIISTEDLERSGRRQAMGFRLEEHLPVSAEDVVIDYLDVGDERAMGVCAELDKLRAIVDAFESAGLHVRHICPAAMLAAAHIAHHHEALDGVLIEHRKDHGNGVEKSHDLVELSKAKPTGWWWFADDDAALRDRLARLSAQSDAPLRLAVLGAADAVTDEGVESLSIDELGADEAAALRAAKVADDLAPPWGDLRRDALAAPGQYAAYRKPAGALMIATVVLLVSVLGVTFWRGEQYTALAERYERQQVEQFKKVLPNQPPPSAIKSRLKSERRKLAGLGGQASDDEGGAPRRSVSALWHLRMVLGSLPTDQRFRVLEVSIEPDLIRVDGQARSYAEAEQLAVRLRESGTYEVAPPETRSLQDRGVRFLFTAKPRGKAAPNTGADR